MERLREAQCELKLLKHLKGSGFVRYYDSALLPIKSEAPAQLILMEAADEDCLAPRSALEAPTKSVDKMFVATFCDPAYRPVIAQRFAPGSYLVARRWLSNRLVKDWPTRRRTEVKHCLESEGPEDIGPRRNHHRSMFPHAVSDGPIRLHNVCGFADFPQSEPLSEHSSNNASRWLWLPDCGPSITRKRHRSNIRAVPGNASGHRRLCRQTRLFVDGHGPNDCEKSAQTCAGGVCVHMRAAEKSPATHRGEANIWGRTTLGAVLGAVLRCFFDHNLGAHSLANTRPRSFHPVDRNARIGERSHAPTLSRNSVDIRTRPTLGRLLAKNRCSPNRPTVRSRSGPLWSSPP